MEIKCTFCGYDGSDLKIGRTMPYVAVGHLEMRCSKCGRVFVVKENAQKL